MTRFVHVSCGLFCSALAVAAVYSAVVTSTSVTPGNGPRPATGLVVDGYDRDLGDVAQSSIHAAEFRIANGFDSAVTLGELQKTCACTEAELSTRSLQPGETAVVKAAVNTGKKRGKLSAKVLVPVTVHEASGSKQGLLTFSITANVIPEVRVDPKDVEFGEDRSQTLTLRLSSRAEGEPLRVTAAYANHNSIATTVRPESAVIDLTFDPAKGDWQDEYPRVSVRTNNPQEPWLDIPVRVRRVSRGTVSKPTVEGQR